MTHELAENKIYGNRLTKINDTFMPQVESQLLSNGINMTEYQKQCVISAIQGINTMLTNSNLSCRFNKYDRNINDNCSITSQCFSYSS